MEGQSRQQLRRDQLKLAGLCPCCGHASCSELDKHKSRLRAKLEARSAQARHCDDGASCEKRTQCHDVHKHDAASVDALLKWIEGDSRSISARRRPTKPRRRPEQDHHRHHHHHHHHHHHKEQCADAAHAHDADCFLADSAIDSEVEAFAALLAFASRRDMVDAARLSLPVATQLELARQCRQKLKV